MDIGGVFLPSEVIQEIYSHFNGSVCGSRLKAIDRVCKLFLYTHRTFQDYWSENSLLYAYKSNKNNKFFYCREATYKTNLKCLVHIGQCPENEFKLKFFN